MQWLIGLVLDSRARAVGSSLTGVTALWSLSKTHLSQLSTGSTQEDPIAVGVISFSSRPIRMLHSDSVFIDRTVITPMHI